MTSQSSWPSVRVPCDWIQFREFTGADTQSNAPLITAECWALDVWLWANEQMERKKLKTIDPANSITQTDAGF